MRCRVWRDVENEGVVYIKAGTAATCRVDKVSRHHVGGFQGKMSVSAVETKAADGQAVMLSWGYGKEGANHKSKGKTERRWGAPLSRARPAKAQMNVR